MREAKQKKKREKTFGATIDLSDFGLKEDGSRPTGGRDWIRKWKDKHCHPPNPRSRRFLLPISFPFSLSWVSAGIGPNHE